MCHHGKKKKACSIIPAKEINVQPSHIKYWGKEWPENQIINFTWPYSLSYQPSTDDISNHWISH
jgi:hypothetical protein